MDKNWSETLAPVKAGLQKHGLYADKNFGQNFLFDLNLTRKIVRESGDLKDYHLMEVGPGPGGLSRILLETDSKSLTLIEKDERFTPLLSELIEHYKNDFSNNAKPVELNFCDALEFDIGTHFDQENSLYIIANLPYNVATPLLIGWLKQAPYISGMSLMFQKEVADRIVAKTGDKHYGRLAILSNYLCQTRILMTLPASAFTPPPKVKSAVVQLIPRQDVTERLKLIPILETLTAQAFNQRRKMLRSSLKSILSNYPDALTECEIKETARAEELSVADFVRLANYLDNH